jgi:hypothetical protein
VKRRAALLLLALAILGVLAVLVVLGRPSRRTAGPLSQEAYIWQRAWGPEMRDSLGRSAGLTGFVVLAAEVDLSTDPPRVSRAAYDASVLRGRPIGLAVRIGRFAHRGGATQRFAERPDLADRLARLAQRLSAGARKQGLEIRSFQLDYDCPESRLSDYPVLVEAVKKALAQKTPVPVTITALPSWLRHRRDLGRLLRAADGWVLQVHSLEPPRRPDAAVELCEPEAARRAVEAAARFRKPFQVALPTYSYLIAFTPGGELLGVSAEGPLPAWPPGVLVRIARSDPDAMAALLRDWTANRPEELQGVIWYRLPVAGDRLNWPWPAFQAVRSGRPPRRALKALPRAAAPGLVEIDLVNAGESEMGWPVRVDLSWEEGELLAADGLAGYQILRTGPRTLRLERSTTPWDRPLRPGERRMVGWLRSVETLEVKASL